MDKPRCEASDIAKTVDVTSRTAVCYLHKLGYYGIAVSKKPFLHPTNVKQRNDWDEMVERSL